MTLCGWRGCERLPARPARIYGDTAACSSALMNLRLRHRRLALQEIEVAALVGLTDMLGEHRAVAARIFRRRLFPGGLAAGELSVADVQMDRALVDVDLDLVAGLHEIKRAA